jgi:hypothetical protein
MTIEPRLLHVANGTSTTMTIEAAGIPGTTSIWADPLHDGPVPGGLDDDALTALRTEHHALSPESADPTNDMRRWRQVIADHDAYDELVLWFEHDLFDQVNLIQLLTFIGAHVPRTKPVSLICINSFPGRPDFHGLGELAPDELASLLPSRRRVEQAQYELAERAWSAFRQPTPEPLNALIGGLEGGSKDPQPRGDPQPRTSLPFLARALERFLQEYPWVGDGLSRSERRLMTLASEGRADWPAVFPRMHEGEDAYYVSDTELIDLKDTLTTASPPLLAETNGTLSLTAAGRDVLDGHADRVKLCGIDRWFGGVHLQGHEVAWRWDGQRRRVIP